MKLERSDMVILDALQKDADRPMSEIAEEAGLSLSTCWRRVKLLRGSGIIRRTVALIDGPKAGLPFQVVTAVKLRDHGQQSRRRFEEFAERTPEIVECRHLAGERDYQVRVIAPDLATYERFMTSVLLELPEVHDVTSNVVLREVKSTTEVPLELLRRQTSA